ncbi:hypothetical protein HDV05_000985 [Chytridiales sp. JEL 0842]|nr:hypothetical protein HDV05_000985 [Chytridiales sp. JEL 0842]
MSAIIATGVNLKDPLAVFKYVEDARIPIYDDNSVLVKTQTASVNPADIFYVNGIYAKAPTHPMPTFPCALGVDGAGIVSAVGAKVTKWKVGDRVMGVHHLMDGGTFGVFSVFHESELARVPDQMHWEVAGSISLVWLTAMKALLQDHRLQKYHNQKLKNEAQTSPPTSSILINGASGGIGSAAVILARSYFNIPTVYAVCSGNIEVEHRVDDRHEAVTV